MKVYFLSTGFGKVPLGLFVQGCSWKRVRNPVLCTLIERDGELVLWDSGMGTRINEEMKPLLYRGNWFFDHFVMSMKFDPARDALVHQLHALGFDLSDVKHVIISHLHWDHAGGMRDLPQAHCIVSKREWDNAVSRKGLALVTGAYIKEQFEGAGLDIELVSTDPNRPYLNFPATYDVFGDGSMVLVDLPGHAPGLMGMFLNLPSGRRFLLSGDAFYFPESLEKKAPKSKLMRTLVSEGPEADETLERLYLLARDEPDLEIVSSHDHRIPGRYDLAPTFYE